MMVLVNALLWLVFILISLINKQTADNEILEIGKIVLRGINVFVV